MDTAYSEETIRKALLTAGIWKAIDKLDAGHGTYKEVDEVAKKLGDKIATELTGMYSLGRFMDYSFVGHNIVEDCCVAAQTNLNAAAGIGIKPKRNKFPRQRFLEAAARIEASEDADALLRTVMATELLKSVDETARFNADFLADAGMQPVVVRTWSGSYPSHDTKRTDWCHDLAGTFIYPDETSKDTFVRHEGCRCTIEYFPNKYAKGRIAALAKGEIDVEGVLYSTKAETLEKRLRKAAK